jgi:hypothetical protein
MSHHDTTASCPDHYTAETVRKPRPLPTVRTDAELLSSIKAHGLEVRWLSWHKAGPLRQVCIRGVSFQIVRETAASPWSLARSGTSGREMADALPGDVWRSAQAHRESARRLDRLLGVLDEMGLRAPDSLGSQASEVWP